MRNFDYSSNYNKIFENNDLELDRQTLDIDKLDIYLSNELSSEIDYRERNNKFFQDNAFVNDISHYSLVNKNFSAYQLDKTSSIADFDILQSSFLSLPGSHNYFYLTSAVN